MNTFHRLAIPLLSAAAILVVGCAKSEPSTAAPAAAAAATDVRVIAITGDDTMKYNLTEIRAKPGEKLRITLANIGRMPKQSMAHNWVLLTPRSDTDLMTWGMAAASKAPTYLPDDKTGILANTKLLGPGEKDQVEFTAPATAGEYPFLCTFPGHVALMKGKLIVN